jgi:TonB-linked SusC/RagA family outer membrane protein
MKKLLFSAILAFCAVYGFAQTRTLTGTVTSSEDNGAIPGVTVVVKGTVKAGITNVEGKFSLEFEGTEGTLEFRFIGLKTVELPITSKNTYNVVMSTESIGLDDIVITAFGISRKKKSLGYSVQNVGNEELSDVKPINMVNAISGKVAGVQITNSTGAVGGASRIVIRGEGSFTNSEPLWVVDGTPFINFTADNDPMSGADFGNGALDIDPSNIASISVLKGANAAALYGSRGANGVILVTTKRGQKSKGVGIEFSSSVTFDVMPYLPDYQNEYGAGGSGSEYYWQLNHPELTYQEYAKQFGYNYVDGMGGGQNDGTPSSWGPRLDAGLLLDQFTGKNQPWISRPNNVRDFYETGITKDNSVSFSKAGEIGSIRAFYSNNTVDGTLPNTDYSKNTIGFNSDLKLHERIKLTTNVNYVINNSDNLPGQGYDGDAASNPQTGVTFLPRQVDIVPLRENWNTINEHGYPYSFGTGETPNPYLTAHNTSSRKRHRIYGNAALDIKITDWLSLKGRAGTDYYTEQRKNIINAITYFATDGSGKKGSFTEDVITGEETNFDVLAMLDKEFGDIRIDGTVGVNKMIAKKETYGLEAHDLVTADLFTISNAKGVQGVEQFQSEKRTNSVFGSFNASYRDYIFLSVTGRNDWSSTLPADEWSYFYPSASMGFIFTDAFNISSDILSYGKIRGGWAKVGRDTKPYMLQSTYKPLKALWEQNGVYSLPKTLPNMYLKPETSYSIEIGGDFRFFKDRVGLDISYYNVKNKDQILNVAVSNSTGYEKVTINAGEIQNTGIEVVLNTTPIRGAGFSWDLDINWAKNNNMVNSLYGDLETYKMSEMWAATIESRPGQPFGTIVGNSHQRDDNGNLLINDSGRILKDNTPKPIGNVTPDWIGGMTNTLTYKNLRLRVLLDAKMGGDFVSGSVRWGGSGGALAFTAADNMRETGTIVEGIRKSDGQPNTTRVSAAEYWSDICRTVENWVIDGSYVKLREVSLGYTLPQSKMGQLGSYVNSIRFTLIARNLAILYRHSSNDFGLDPETGSGSDIKGMGYEQMQIPTARNIGARLTFSF